MNRRSIKGSTPIGELEQLGGVTDSIPLVDIADGPTPAVGKALDEALRRSGFVLVTGHGVPDDGRRAARAAAREFFALDPTVKQRYAVAVGGHGYLGPGAEANAAAEGVVGPPDLKESWTVGADRPTGDPEIDAVWFAPNSWPAEVPALQRELEAHMARMRAVADTLLEIGAVGLGLPVDHFTRHTRHPSYTLNVNRYPPLTQVGAPAEGQFRIGPHTDFGTVTVLDREPGAGGLQVDMDGTWTDAPYVEGAFTINVGDLLSQWTGGRWRSTRHRVLPPQASAPDEDLVSLVFFYELDPHTVVESLGPPIGHTAAPPVRAADYLADKLAAITVAQEAP